jgi:transposase InsO family protein
MAWRWHARYGHLHFDALGKLARDDMVCGLPLIERIKQLCDGCLVGKHKRSPFPQQAKYRATDLLDLVHGDLCGPITPATPGGKRYFLLLVDDCSRYMTITLLVSKDEASKAIKLFIAGAESKMKRKVRALRANRGAKFTSNELNAYCAELGVKRHLTAPYSPQQNDVVERRNQMVVGMARCLLKAKGVPGRFWGEAVTTAVYLLNRAPTMSLAGKTPFEAWYGWRPNVHYLRTFGFVAHVKVVKPNQSKLDDRSRAMVLFGYEPGSKAYRVYDPVAKRIHVTRDMVFDESSQWNWTENGDDKPAGMTESFSV